MELAQTIYNVMCAAVQDELKKVTTKRKNNI